MVIDAVLNDVRSTPDFFYSKRLFIFQDSKRFIQSPYSVIHGKKDMAMTVNRAVQDTA